jgi:hypothetical protein
MGPEGLLLRKFHVGQDRHAIGPSVFDFNNDGTTDELDEAIVAGNFGNRCDP